MREALHGLQKKAEAEIASAKRLEEFLAIRTRYLGRKGLLTDVLRRLKDVAPEERPALGKLSNDIKESISKRLDQVLADIQARKK